MYRRRSTRIANPAAYAAACARNAMAARAPTRKRTRKATTKAVAFARAPTGYRLRGRGDYTKTATRYGSKVGSKIGKTLGGAVGGLIGRGLNGIGKILGFGDYVVKSNSLMPGKDSVPSFGSGNGGIRVQHREYIQDVFSSGKFQSESFSINPGLSATFPWLSAVAQNFEQYKVHGMVFEYKTTSSDALNSTDTALGSVIMSTEYNVLLPPFINKQQMENNMFTVSGKPSLSLMHPIECDPRQTPIDQLNVRTGAVTTGDLRLYDLGTFQFATVGMQETDTNLGELWCTYDIEFFKPKLSSGLNLSGKTGKFTVGGGVNYINPTQPFGNAPPRVDFNEAGLEWSSSSALGPIDTFSLPLGSNGLFRFTYRVRNTPASGVVSGTLGAGPIQYTNCQPVQMFQDYSSSEISNMGLDFSVVTGGYGGVVDWIFSQVLQINDPAEVASVTFDTSGSAGLFFGNSIGSYTLGDFIIGQINGDVPVVPPTAIAAKMTTNDIEALIERVMSKRMRDESKEDFDIPSFRQSISSAVSSAASPPPSQKPHPSKKR